MKATMYKSIKGCQKLVLKVTLHFLRPFIEKTNRLVYKNL